LEFTFYETKWLCWQDLWHGADACYGREAKKKKIKFSEAFGRGAKDDI
jgi:hypothetical protein